MNALFNSYNKKKNYSSTDWTGISSPGDSNGQEQSWMKGDQDYPTAMGQNKKSYRGYLGAAAGLAGGIAKGMDNTQFGDFRDDTDNITEGAMNVVGQFGTVGAVINGAYNVINSIAKPIRAKAERTDAWGTMQTPRKAGHMAVIGALLDPISAITTRRKLGYWGANGQKYSEKLQQKLYEEYNAKQQPFLQARNLELEGIAANYQNNQEPKGPGDYYKFGGSLVKNYMSNQKAVGGSMQPMSKDTTVAVGPSHAQGGIGLPNQGAEVEGGETTAGNYVFSKELGFAKLHMPIAKAKGKVENKPATRERLNTLKLLNKKENDLKLFQEYTKKQLNVQ